MILLGHEPLATGDLIVAEVLQGFASESAFRTARKMLLPLTIIEFGGRDVAIQAAQNFPTLRRLGVSVRRTIDTLIATRCIVSSYELLHDHPEFDPFVLHLGLQVAA